MSNAFDEQVGAAKKYLTQTEYNALSVLRPLFDKQAEEIERLKRLVRYEYCRGGAGVSRITKCSTPDCGAPISWRTNNPDNPICLPCCERLVLAALAEKPRSGAGKPEEG